MAHKKKAAKALKWGDAECFNYVAAMAAEGYKITFTLDEENSAYTVSATGKTENPGMTMTQRHSDLNTAVMAHYVAHVQISDRKWPEPNNPLFDLDW